MLRPATPLTVLFLIAFILLLLSTLSVPVISSIPLAAANGTSFGVFGFCFADGTCSKPIYGYSSNIPGTFDVPTQDRQTLSYILIVHPIATFMVFICTILAAAAHFRSPAHSPRFLLGLLIFSFPTLLVTLLAFLVDILLFIPHLKWGGWIALPATIIVTACGVLTCAMRRTLVSRKARKRRVAENEDMNGTDYYQMKADTQLRPLEPQYARAESPPPMDSASLGTGTAVYDKMAPPSGYDYDRPRGSMDDRMPLNPRNDASRNREFNGRQDPNGSEHLSGSTMVGASREGMSDEVMRPVSPLEESLDERPPLSAGSRSNSYNRGGMAPPYGNRGTPPYYGRGRGVYPPRGPMRGGYYPPRGNYPPRGAYPPRGRGRGPPPPGWEMAPRGGPMMRGRPPPPPGYGYPRGPPQDYLMRNPYDPSFEQQQYSRSQDDYLPDEYVYDQAQPAGNPRQIDDNSVPLPAAFDRPSSSPSTRDPRSFGFSGRHSPARSQTGSRVDDQPPPMPQVPDEPTGQAFELDTRRSVASPQLATDVLGEQAPRGDHSAGTYLPMNHWSGEPVEIGDRSPPQPSVHSTDNADHSTMQRSGSNSQVQNRGRDVSGSYYEDTEPRFSGDDAENPISSHQSEHIAQQPVELPPSLTVGAGRDIRAYQPEETYLAPANRNDTHSPAQSDNSNFTSISQRGINPNWQGEPSGFQPRPPQRARTNDAILANNPDFIVPQAGSSRGHVRGLSSGGGGRYPGPGAGMP